MSHSIGIYVRDGAQEMRSPTGTRTLLAFDIAGFGDPQRDDDTRVYIRTSFYELIGNAFQASGIDGHACYIEDRGDGAIVVFPAETQLVDVLEPLVDRLRAGVFRHNRVSSANARLRLRVAIHIGEVQHDGHGLVGTDVNHVFRLLDSMPIKRVMTAARAQLAIIVSDRVYSGVVCAGEGALVPEDYASVRVRLKETDAQAWLRVPGSAPAPPAAPPSLLPRDTPAFTGRSELLARLDALADAHRESGCVAVLAGMPGGGKTALAVHWARLQADRFPDGRFHVSLGAYTAHPLRPDDALAHILRMVGGVPADVPSGLRERIRLWRAWTATRKVLLVLDDVADSGQVQMLLPDGPGCMTVVTSRSTPEALVAVSGAELIEVPVLPPEDATALMRTIIGARRMNEEPDAAKSMIGRCAGLPIALRIAAAKIAVRPHRTIDELVDELTGASGLSNLRSIDSPSVAVVPVFDASYVNLGTRTRRLLRLIGLVPGPTFTTATAALLLGASEPEAAPLLDELEREHLVEPITTSRYRVHDLIHDYCRARLSGEEPAQVQAAAFRKLAEGSLNAATEYRRHLGHPGWWLGAPAHPDDSDATSAAMRRAALDWFEAEWQNLAAIVNAAHAAGMWEIAVRLADTLYHVLDLSRRIRQNNALQQLAAHAAARSGDLRLEALSLQRLAHCQGELAEYAAALRSAEHARTLARRIRDHAGECEAQRLLGLITWRMGRYDAAHDHARTALRLARDSGDESATAKALNLLANVERRRGRYGAALGNAQEALRIWQRLDDRGNQASTYGTIGSVLQTARSRTVDALEAQRHALRLFRFFGNPRGEADALDGIARVLGRLDRHTEAIAYALQACEIRQMIGDYRGEAESWDTLTRIHRQLGDKESDQRHYESARESAEKGIALAVEINDRYGEAALRSNYARVLLAIGDVDRAVAEAERAIQIGADLEDPFGQAKRLKNSALVLRAAEKTSLADDRFRRAQRLRTELAESGIPESD